ncbi:MAG: extracellular solute-binding protein [Candidatus Sumerlaeota bacterium]|nr:extracellular solute-binding protein [Candidatus Sumerlaeota bacterium]
MTLRTAKILLLALFCAVCGVLARAATEPVTLEFWHVYTDRIGRDTIDKLVKRYKELHPHVNIKLLGMPWNQSQKLLTAIVGGVPPDVSMIDRPRVPQWASRNALEPLDDLIMRDNFDGSVFFKNTWDEAMYEGRRYVIPINTDARMLYYNKKRFREAGLDPEKPPRTWRELEEYSDRLTVRDAQGHLEKLGYAPLFGSQGFGTATLYTYAWQLGGDVMTSDVRKALIDSEPWVKGLEWSLAFCTRYGARDLAAFSSNLGSYSQDPFISGKIAMQEHGSWYLSLLNRYGKDVDFGIAMIPIPEGGTPAFLSAGWSLGIPRGARHKQEAWEFIKFMTGKEGQEILGPSISAIPSNRLATQIPYYQDDPHWKQIIGMMEHARHHPSTPQNIIAWEQVGAAVERVTMNGEEPRAALKRAAKLMQDEVDRFLRVREYPFLPMGRIYAVIALAIIVMLGAYALWFWRRVRRSSLHREEALTGLGLASPWVIGFILFVIGPIIVSLVYSLTDFQILTEARFVGLANYKRLFTDDKFFRVSLYNTAYFVLFVVPLGLGAALALAVLLNGQIVGVRVYRTAFYLPTVVSGVAASVLWMWLLNPEQGLINQFLRAVGLPGPLWLQSPAWSKPALILMGLWGVGGSMVIFLAGLQSIPGHLYEAATIDGAGAWRRFFHISLPLLTPTIFFNLVVGVIGGFQLFTPAYVMTSGGPADSTLFYALYVFRQGFEYFKMGYASALAWVLFVVVLILTGIQLAGAKRWVHYTEE